MKVSAVIPAYNRAALLPACLDAMLDQRRKPDEILVVDDGSTDDTGDVADRYAASYPDLIRVIHTENRGDLPARAVGTEAASGDLIAYCDSDDLWGRSHVHDMARMWDWCPSMLGAYANFHIIGDHADSIQALFSPENHGRSKFAGAAPGFWDGLAPADPEAERARAGADTSTRSARFDFAIASRPMVGDLIRFQPFFPSALMVHRERFLAAGSWDTSPGRTLGGDFATALRVAEHVPLGICMRASVAILKHEGNRSGDVQRMNLGDALILEQLLPVRPALAEMGDAVRQSIASRRREAMATAFSRGDIAGVREIAAMLQRDRAGMGAILRTKAMIAQLPTPLAAFVQRVLVAGRSRPS